MKDFEPLVYRVATISKLFWSEYLEVFEEAWELVTRSESKIYAFGSFTLEVFHRLYYEAEPEILDPMPPESLWAKQLHSELDRVIGASELVEKCQGNQLAAGIATVEYCRSILEQLPDPIPRFDNPQVYRNAIALCVENPQLPPKETLKKLISKIPSGKQKQKLRDLVEQADSDREELIQLLQREGKQAVEIAVAYASNFEGAQIRKMLRAALVDSTNKLAELEEWLAMLGLSWGNEPASNRQVSVSEKIALVQKIASNERLKQIAKLAGRFRETAERKYRSQAKDAYGEIASVELGNNLWRLLPGELQKLTDPALFPLFARGYYDRSLLQYQFKGKEKQNRGPLIVCLDSSGSMDGLPDTWAKATAAVLGQIAQRDNRHFRIIHFSSRVCRIDDFPPQARDYSKLLESMLSFFAGGGTNWEAALVTAIECIEEQQDYTKADIVMITDGLCNVSRAFGDRLQQQKERWQFSIYGVLISTEQTSHERLKKFCDRLWVISDLYAENIVIEELFEL